MIWTNGAYWVDVTSTKNLWKKKRILGTITKTIYPQVYKIGDSVNFPVYNNYKDRKPMFRKVSDIRIEKISNIINEYYSS